MSDTVRNEKHKKWYNKESASNRRAWTRKMRHNARRAIAAGQEPDRVRHTQGWLTH